MTTAISPYSLSYFSNKYIRAFQRNHDLTTLEVITVKIMPKQKARRARAAFSPPLSAFLNYLIYLVMSADYVRQKGK